MNRLTKPIHRLLAGLAFFGLAVTPALAISGSNAATAERLRAQLPADKTEPEHLDTSSQTPSPDAITVTAYPLTAGSGGALEDMSSGTTQLVAASQDDTASALTNLGFDFWYDGVRQTQFSVNANGLLKLGSPAVSTGFTNSLASTTDAPKLSAYWDDMCTGTNGKVHYKVVGTAPTRKLVVEWQNMQITRGAGCSGAGNGTFQVWLFESTGVVEFVYGTIQAAAAVDGGYSVGLQSGAATNFASITTTGNTVSYAAANNAQTNAITAGTTYTFNPNTPTAPTSLTFTSVNAGSITLNWTDSPNEFLYAIYNSTDGTNFTFFGTAAQNATSFVASGLTQNTPYTWRVAAVSEGALSAALEAPQSTPAAGNIASTAAGGLWSATTTWVGGVVPTAGDNVTIADGATVTIDTAAVAYSLTVGTGGATANLVYDAATARTLTVGSDVTVATNGSFRAAATGTVTTHSLSLSGNLTNNGTIDFSTNTNTAGAGITFTGTANTSLTLNAGSNTDFRQTTGVTVNKGTSSAPVLTFIPGGTITVLGANAVGFLAVSNGTFKLDGTNTFSNPVFNATGYTIAASGGFWLNNPNATVAGLGGSPTNNGLLRISQGTFNVGTAAGNSMAGGAGSVFTIEGGTTNVAGRFNITNATTYNQSAGTINVSTVGNASSSAASFGLTSASSSFNMTGGTINLVQASTGATPFDFQNSASVVATSGTLQVGTAATATNFNFRIRGTAPNLIIDNTTNNKTATAIAQLNLRGTTLIKPGTTLALNGFVCLVIGPTFTNNGTLNGTVAASRFYFLGGLGPTTYTGTGTVTAPLTTWEIDNTDGVTIDPAVSNATTLALRIFSGSLTNTNKITLGNGGATAGTVQIGNTTTPTAAGTFDVAPTFNLGTGGQTISYLRTTLARTTGPEINPTRTLTSLTYDDNDTSHSLTVAGGDLTAGTTLALTNGRVITGSNVVAAGSATSVTRTTGYVDGNFRKTYSGAGSKTFEVGSANGYTPVTANLTAAGGFPSDVTVKSVQGTYPGLPQPSFAAARNWTVAAPGATVDLTFSYLDPTDITTVTEANLKLYRNDAGTYTDLGATMSAAANTAATVGTTTFGDFFLAEPGATTYTVTAAVSGSNGTITPASQQVAPSGTASFTVTPDPNYHVVSVTGTTCSVTQVGATTTWNSNAITQNCAVTATFAIDQFAVTAAAPGGNGSITPASQQVDYNTTASFTVTPNTGYHVVGVVGDTCTVTQVGATTTWNSSAITQACAVTATFAIDQYTVTAAAPGGNGTITPPSQQVNYNSTASFTVTPNATYHVVSVTGDTCTVTQVGATTTWNSNAITQPCAVTATFAIDQFAVTASVSGGNGSITPPSQQVNSGSTASFTVTPNSGFHVNTVTGDTCTVTQVGATTTWNSNAITQACAVTATFAADQFTVNATVSGGNGSISPLSQQVNSGSSASFTVTPNAGFHTNTVTGDTCTVTQVGATMTWNSSAITQACSVTATFAPDGSPGKIVISQLYGGGGNSGATYQNDYIELFNAGGTAVDISNWSVQYASATGTSWTNKTDIPAGTIIQPGKYFLIKEASNAAVGAVLPTPDLSPATPIAMAAAAGKIALTSNTTVLTGNCPTGSAIKDFVGYGTTADCREGGATTAFNAPVPSATLADFRDDAGCTDTDVNSADFTSATAPVSPGLPAPRNGATPANICAPPTPTNPTVTGSASPSTVAPGGPVHLAATVVAGTNPVSTGLAVTVDTTSIGGTTGVTMFDDGLHNDGAANDKVFGLDTTVSAGTAVGGKTLALAVSDAQSRNGTGSISLTVAASTPPSVSAATATPASVAQGGNTHLAVTVTPGTTPASTGLAVTVDTSSIGGAAGTSMFDDGAHGDGAANDNVFGLDVTVTAATPVGAKNLGVSVTDAQSRSGTGNIALTVTQAVIDKTIMQIQGNGLASPFAADNNLYRATGVVTAKKATSFAMQDPVGDGNTDTSDGIIVFGPSTTGLNVGDSVTVTGKIVEFNGTTEFSGSVSFVNNGPVTAIAPIPLSNILPSPDPTAHLCAGTLPSSNPGAGNWECIESMLVSMNGIVVGGTNGGFAADATHPGTPSFFFATVDTQPRPFREKGIAYPGAIGLPVWDGDPEIIEFFPSQAFNAGLTTLVKNAGQHFTSTSVVGDFNNTYELYPVTFTDTGSPPVTVQPVAAAPAGAVTIASQNMLHFFDTVNDAGTSDDCATQGTTDICPTQAQFDIKVAKLSKQVREVLQAPTVVGVQEVENINALNLLAAKINADDNALSYTARLIEGNDVGGIDVGFLVRSDVTINSTTQIGKNTQTTYCSGASPCLLNDRPPLLLDATTAGGYHFAVLVIHGRSLSSIESPTDGDRVRHKRLEQAQYVGEIVQKWQTGNTGPMSDGTTITNANANVPLVVIGDFNAYEFTDGYVDVTGQIKGSIVPADNMLSAAPITSPSMCEAGLKAPAATRYSFMFDGYVQDLDHSLFTRRAWMDFLSVGYAHGNADTSEAGPEVTDPNTAARSADHDGQVVRLLTDRIFADGFEDPATICQ